MLVVALAVVLLAAIAWPMATPLFFAMVLAGALHPLTVRLARHLRGKKKIASGLVTLMLVLAVIGPIAGLVAMTVGQAKLVVKAFEEANASGRVTAAIERLPRFAQSSATDVMKKAPSVAALVQGAASVDTVTGLLSTTGQVALDLALFIIALFVLLSEGPQFVDWMERLLPVPSGQFRSLLSEFQRVSRSALVATGATAAAQAAVGLVGLLIAQVPNPLFFTLLSFFLAMIPAVGGASCFVVLGALYLLDGHPVAGVFLLCWGVLVVGLVDNIIKPLVIRDGAEMHGAVVFFSLIGGLATFGIAGLIAGPLVVAFFIAVMRVRQAPPPKPIPARAPADQPSGLPVVNG